MRHSTRRLAGPAKFAVLAVVLTASAAPVLAKESIDAQLVAPIARDTPGGTTLLLEVWVRATDATGTHDVDGSPVYVRLYGPDGAATWALASPGAAGHYTVRLAVPASGVKSVEVGMHDPTDMPFNLVGFTIVPGSISARTAQAVPAIEAASPPAARASAPAPRAVPPLAPAVDPTTSITPVAASRGPATVLLIAGAVALVAAALAFVAIVRRARIPAQRRASGRAPEA